MPTFHPAYLLRNPSAKRIMWEDCKKVMAEGEEVADQEGRFGGGDQWVDAGKLI